MLGRDPDEPGAGHRHAGAAFEFPDGDAMVVVAANDGGAAHPGWYFNLAASPHAAVEVNGRRVRVRASELGPEAAGAWWQRILMAAPEYQRYRRATTRPFPVLRLAPLGREASLAGN